jgi:hypothetical protein
MGETEWKHAGWVSGLGKWAWIILFVLGIIHVIVGLAVSIPAIAAWETLRAYYASLAIPFNVPMPIGGLIWNIIGAVISIIIALFIIRPKFSKPCGANDWEALYGWTLKLGSLKFPWMFIWGIVYAIFGFYNFPAIFILLPACMIIFAGPRKYNWIQK